MIYKYDEIVALIENFVGKDLLGEHQDKRQFFNPDISIKNTQIFNSNQDLKNEVDIIERSCLKEKLNKFPYIVHANSNEFSDPDPDTSIKMQKD